MASIDCLFLFDDSVFGTFGALPLAVEYISFGGSSVFFSFADVVGYDLFDGIND